MNRISLALLSPILLSFTHADRGVFGDDRPNVLFISVDDLNDWVSLFGGHPQTKTPNIERLATQGGVVFQNAHCPGPVCGPCRSALLSGFMPHRTGVYGNSQNMLGSSFVQEFATLPEYFAKHGYATISRGKIFHAHATTQGRDQGQWAFEHWEKTEGGTPVDRSRVTSRDKNLIDGKPAAKSQFTKNTGSEFSWGPTTGGMNKMRDYVTAKWAAEVLARPSEKPIFLAVGISKPHLPFYCPQDFFDLYPIDQVKVNPIREDDLDDILRPNGCPHFSASMDYQWLKENELLEEATQAYLACCSFADACVGVILDGLANSPKADNTIVIVWGDHGWHLGEKLRYRKATGWSESTRLPLLIRTPAMSARKDCTRPVNLIDLYPTLIEYCGLPEKPAIDGDSLVPLLQDPTHTWRDATVTIFGEGNASVCGERWRLIQHNDGTEELYDLRDDPQEWNNLIAKMTPDAKAAKARLSHHLPSKFARPLKKSDAKLKANAKGVDETLKASRNLSALK